MYAGAVRETVFCNPEVVRRVNADFVALALKAQLVNNVAGAGPGDADETRLYQALRRAMLAPQGIGVLSGDGRILAWTQMFDADTQILPFFDHALKLQGEAPAKTERYMSFPGKRMKDLENAAPEAFAGRHEGGKRCPALAQAKSAAPRGALVARLCGRALDQSGKPVADTVRQEHYVQDQFVVTAEMQETIAKILGADGSSLPSAFGELVASHAHLGHIDVRPLMKPNVGNLKRATFRATKMKEGLYRIDGVTEVASDLKINGSGVHDVELAWTGFMEFKGDRMTSLIVSARGTEKLKFDNGASGDEAARLNAGRGIDQHGGVRYGIVGEPVAEDRAVESGPLSIQSKMQKLGPLVQRRMQSGADMAPVMRILQRIEPFMKQGKHPEAEAAIDEALKLLSGIQE